MPFRDAREGMKTGEITGIIDRDQKRTRENDRA